jgi:hypothetical protein
MSQALTDLIEIKRNLIDRLKELTANPRPSYSIEGRSVSWTELMNAYAEQIKWINDLITIESTDEIVSVIQP